MAFMTAAAWAATAAVTSTAAGLYGSATAAKAQNEAASRAEANAQQRYNIENSQTVSMMEEQKNMAMSKMTDISRDFVLALGSMEAAYGESETGGNVKKRLQSNLRTKTSEIKDKVATEVNSNIVNLAQGVLASKIDTQAMIAEARASRQNVFTQGVMGALSGANTGINAASGIKNLS